MHNNNNFFKNHSCHPESVGREASKCVVDVDQTLTRFQVLRFQAGREEVKSLLSWFATVPSVGSAQRAFSSGSREP